jgi:hypothetical protein
MKEKEKGNGHISWLYVQKTCLVKLNKANWGGQNIVLL